MIWAARIEHTDSGLRLRFATPTSTLDMTSETAAHLGSLLAIEARARVAGVVRILMAENKPNALARRESQKQLCIGTSDAHPLCCDCDNCLNGDHHG